LDKVVEQNRIFARNADADCQLISPVLLNGPRCDIGYEKYAEAQFDLCKVTTKTVHNTSSEHTYGVSIIYHSHETCTKYILTCVLTAALSFHATTEHIRALPLLQSGDLQTLSRTLNRTWVLRTRTFRCHVSCPSQTRHDDSQYVVTQFNRNNLY